MLPADNPGNLGVLGSLPDLPPRIRRANVDMHRGLEMAGDPTKDISVPAQRIDEIIQGKRAITPDTALRLSRYFGLSERFWLNLQPRDDLEVEKDRLADRLEREAPVVLVPA